MKCIYIPLITHIIKVNVLCKHISTIKHPGHLPGALYFLLWWMGGTLIGGEYVGTTFPFILPPMFSRPVLKDPTHIHVFNDTTLKRSGILAGILG